MTTNIILNQREIDTLGRASEILKEYSRIYSESVRNKSGMYFDNAGSAAGILDSIIKESAPKAETIAS